MDPRWALIPIAVAMALIMARLVVWASTARTRLSAAVVVFLLAMMAAMFLGSLLYADSPNISGVVLALWVAAAIMAISIFPVFTLFVDEVRARAIDGPAYRPRPLGSTTGLVLAVAWIVVLTELLMGRSFELLDGSRPAPGGAGTSAFVAIFASPWFLLPMGLEMAAAWYWLRDVLPKALLPVLGAQAGLMAAAPPAFPGLPWVLATGAISAGLSLGVYVHLAERFTAEGRADPAVDRYALALVASFSVSAVGLVLWATTGELVGFAAASVLQAFLFFAVAVAPERFASPRRPGEAAERHPRPHVEGGTEVAPAVRTSETAVLNSIPSTRAARRGPVARTTRNP